MIFIPAKTDFAPFDFASVGIRLFRETEIINLRKENVFQMLHSMATVTAR